MIDPILQLFSKRVNKVPKSFIRELLKVTVDKDVISFAGGLPNTSFFPIDELAVCAQYTFQKAGKQALQYAPSEGHYPLRTFLAQRYQMLYGLDVDPENILITTGSQQALDLLGKLFLDKEDQVLVERPSYMGALQCLSMYEPEFTEIPLGDEGVDAEELDRLLKKQIPKLFYCIPNFQNPTGLRYTLHNRKRVAEVIQDNPVVLVEDDPYGEIYFDSERFPPIFSFLPNQTVLLGSFSKIIAPGLRLGWMVARKDIIEKAVILKQASDLHSDNLAQHIIYEYLTTFDINKHIDKIRQGYKLQRDVMMDALHRYFPSSVRFTKPEGGMFTWLSLPEKIRSRELLEKALKEKIIFVPGDTFYTSQPDQQTIRLNFSNVEGNRMRTAMEKLGQMIT